MRTAAPIAALAGLALAASAAADWTRPARLSTRRADISPAFSAAGDPSGVGHFLWIEREGGAASLVYRAFGRNGPGERLELRRFAPPPGGARLAAAIAGDRLVAAWTEGPAGSVRLAAAPWAQAADGAAWSPPLEVGSAALEITLAGGPDEIVDIAFLRRAQPALEIVHRRSEDGGASWSEPSILRDRYSEGPPAGIAIARDPDGGAKVSWVDHSASSLTGTPYPWLRLAVSNRAASRWESPPVNAWYDLSFTRLPEKVAPRLAIDDRYVHLVWREAGGESALHRTFDRAQGLLCSEPAPVPGSARGALGAASPGPGGGLHYLWAEGRGLGLASWRESGWGTGRLVASWPHRSGPPPGADGAAVRAAPVAGDRLLAAFRACRKTGACTLYATLSPPFPPPPPAGAPPVAAPAAGAPACDRVRHDPGRWHGLWDPEGQCHWDHEHKEDPNLLNDVFGPPGAWFGGGEISYPWQTFYGADESGSPPPDDPSLYENAAKHRAYGWLARRDVPALGRETWIRDFRLQFHAMSAPPGTLTRFHSFSLEARVCSPGGCGILRKGGWLDFGNLQMNEDPRAILEGEKALENDLGRRRLHYFYPDGPRDGERADFFWYGRHRPATPTGGLPLRTHVALASADAWANLLPDDPSGLHLFCPEADCALNGSTIQAHLLVVDVLSERQPYSAFTDRYGRPAESCEAVGLDCVPLIIDGVPRGPIQYRDDVDLCLGPRGLRDHDVSPPGERWIRFPN